MVRAGPTALVALAAAAVTAHGLVEVAVAARVPEPMAWAYPVITDGLALVAYRATSHLSSPGARYAWVVVVTAAGMSGLAQAVYLASDALVASAGLRFGVGAWPAVAAAVAAHLLHLLWRADRPATQHEPTIVASAADIVPPPDSGGDQTLETPALEPHAVEPPPVAKAMSDAERIADLRAHAAELGRMPGRDSVKARYGVGSTVADRLRTAAEKPPLHLAAGGAR